jgi:hypothetical protein
MVVIGKGIRDGDMPGDIDVDALAAFVNAIVRGLAVQARDGASRSKLLNIVGSRWRPGRSQASPPHKPTEEPVYPWATGRFMMMSDRRRLSRMVRHRDRALTPSCEVERGASALRRLVPHVEVFGPPNALGEGPNAAFYVRPTVIDSQIFSRTGSLSRRCPTCSSLPRKAPVRTCPPGSGRGRFVFA